MLIDSIANSSMSSESRALTRPLYVDLDGTLIHSDLLLESFLELIKKNVFYIFLIPFWLIKGKANLKHQIASRVTVRVELLPYNSLLLDHLRQQKSLDRELILISASNKKLVAAVADHLELFSSHLGSTDSINLSGKVKLEKIQQSYNSDKFDYAGNSNVDLPLWEKAHQGIVVSDNENLIAKAKLVTNVSQTYSGNGRGLRGYLKLMRLHQWLKNGLLFLPLILSHQLDQSDLVVQALLAFLSFGFCASGVYVLNDLLDLPNDRQHQTKCNRPLAAGNIPLVNALLLSPVLLFCSFLLASRLPDGFVFFLTVYFLITSFYSFYLKKIVMVDVLTLAGLFTLRIIAGGAAVSVLPTFWLLAFSMFLFLSLAMVKRYTELHHLQAAGIEKTEGRGYQTSDREILASLGCASGYMAVLVFALYINDENTRFLYQTPQILWFICPLLLLLISRVWLIAYRGQMQDDPVIYALRDRFSQVVMLLCALFVWAAGNLWNNSALLLRFFDPLL